MQVTIFKIEPPGLPADLRLPWEPLARFSCRVGDIAFHGALLVRHTNGELDLRLPRSSYAFTTIRPSALKAEIIDAAFAELQPTLPVGENAA